MAPPGRIVVDAGAGESRALSFHVSRPHLAYAMGEAAYLAPVMFSTCTGRPRPLSSNSPTFSATNLSSTVT